jgi:L-arabinose isomerase
MTNGGLQAVRTLLLSPYWAFWEDSVGDIDLRADRLTTLGFLTQDLEAHGVQVAASHVAEPGAEVPEIARPDVVIVAVTMAAPPDTITAMLDHLDPAVPVIVWALLQPVHAGAGTEAIVRDGATVGTPLLTSALHRAARPYVIIAGSRTPDTVGRVAVAARGLALAGNLRQTRLGRIGHPIPGYVSVDAPDEALAHAFGLQIVHIDPGQLRAASTSVSEAALSSCERELPTQVRPTDTLDLGISLRLRQGLHDLTATHDLSGGAINCHGPQLRHHEEIGVTPCYALGMETTAGKPWTCTGDILTAVAMLIAKRLSGAALYHEIESLDPETGTCLLANSGEFDLAWSGQDGTARCGPNPWFQSDAKVGLSVRHDLAPGPATLIAVVRQLDHPSGFRIVAATGQILEGLPDGLPTAGGNFRFDAGSVKAWERWIEAGVSHHSALAKGDVSEGVRALAQALGTDYIDI